MKVPYLTRDGIEDSANKLLMAYGRLFGWTGEPPVPVEEIVECHLELDFGFDDFSASQHGAGTLGAMWVAERRVRIDESLDPTVHPAREGRYRFTVAHETGHWELHRPLFLARAQQPSFFDREPDPNIVCRAPAPQAKKEPIEWQADTFAGFLLMPKATVMHVWESMHGTPDPYFAATEIAVLSAKWSLAEDRTPTVGVAREMAECFHVSAQAMQIRLLDLGLIRVTEREPELFDLPGNRTAPMRF
jgi:Zn-dependent peptidase ImmA (M78 family)